jgi:tRNA A-37 threonylcarbamoyl transferase component Bud32
MSSPDEATGSHHDPLDAVIASYLQQVEAGAVPDREALLAQHPDLAEGLREFFADFDRLDRQAGELHLPGAPESAGERPHVRYFGEYELLEVIARGGMGVVYKARQQSLNRLVALKMILQGQLATPRAVARFRAEAEAAANLDHPHIVPIHEVGEHEGQQYFTMRFIEGSSLARQTRGDLRSEARLVATVARAVHYAHQHGILHRDLKPSNILVADGVPFVTDFGLAKRLDGAGDLTGTGEIPGTPRYMAPEQAAGRKDLTVAADVFSLGVVLYERLTGRTPFLGDDLLEILRQVREAQPPRPSSLRPGLDRDLETACLKCLEKEPAKRYPSAEALADDLERWLRGEPILARPVGSLGRLMRWGRRSPVVAALMGAVTVSLLAGTSIATYFAVQAERRASAEQAERERAQAAEADLERALARSLVRPLARQRRPTEWFRPLRPAPLSEPEAEALWDLAQAAQERLRLCCLQEAIRTESTAIQLRSRAEYFVHAAVGLDRERRARAAQLLAEGMVAPARSLRHRTEIAWACLEVSESGSPIERASAEVIAQGLAAEEDRNRRATWREVLFQKAPTIEPGTAAGLLMTALAQDKNDGDLWSLSIRLAQVGQRLEPVEAARMLSRAFEQAKSSDDQRAFAEGLATVAERLDAGEAARVCMDAIRLLQQALRQPKNQPGRGDLLQGLVALANRLEAAVAGQLLTEALKSADDQGSRKVLAQGLTAAAERLAPADAAQLLTEALGKEKDHGARVALAEGLAVVAGRLGPTTSARARTDAVGWLVQTLGQEGYDVQRGNLAQDLTAVVRHLEPTQAVQLLTQALAQEKASLAREHLAKGLAGAVGKLESVAAACAARDAARLLTQLFRQEPPSGARAALAEALAAVAARLGPAEAARVREDAARLVTQALKQVVGQLTQSQAVFPGVLARDCERLAVVLAELAGPLGPTAADRVCEDAARMLNQSLERQTTDDSRAWLACHLGGALAAVAGRLEPAAAARVCKTTVRLLDETLAEFRLDDDSRPHFAKSLASLTARLGPAEAVWLLSRALQREQKDAARSWLAAGLADVTARLDTPDAAGVAGFWVLECIDSPDDFQRLCRDYSAPQVTQRAAAIATMTAAAEPIATLVLLPSATDPLPCRFSTEHLVELLKMPTCAGEVWRVLLDHLSNRYHRRFNTHWDFVRYAQEQGLNLDFTTPPKRPEAKLPPLFEP